MKGKVSRAMIAEAAGVAVSTAGFILSGKAREMKISEKSERRVLEIARELGYIPNAIAKSLRNNRSGIVGLLYNHLKHNWADDSLNGIRRVLNEKGYSVFLSTHQFQADVQKREIDQMLQHRFDAIICVPFKGGVETYKEVLRSKTPLIFLNDSLEEMPEVNMVAWDAREAAKVAVRHLIGLGRKKIAYLGWDDERPMFRARIESYRECLQAAGIEYDPSLIRTFPLVGSVESDVREIFHDVESRPDAIFAGLDNYGIEAIAVLESMGLRVPEDVALVGMGDQPGSCYPSVGLSSLAIPSGLLGEKAARLAMDLLESKGGRSAEKVMIRFNDLKLRRSTAL